MKRVRDLLGAAVVPALYTLFTVVVFRRLLADPAESVTAYWDATQMIWNLWWVKTALVDLHTNPFFTDYIFHPQRVALLFHTLVPFYGVVSIPVQVWVEGARGAVLAYNLALMSTFPLAGWFLYLLARDVSGSRLGAFAGGAAYAFSTFHLSSHIHLNVASLQWMPLVLFAVRRHLVGGDLRFAVLAGLAFAAQIFCDLFYALTTVLLALVLLLWSAARQEARDTGIASLVRRAGVLVLCCAPPVALLSAVALQTWSAGAWPATPWAADALPRSADLAAFVLPDERHSLYGSFFESISGSYGRNPEPSTGFPAARIQGDRVFLGFGGLLCAALGILGRRRPERWLWGGLFAVALWLALGPVVQAYGQDVNAFPSLYGAFGALPFADMGRAPYRFLAVATLALGVLTAQGVAWARRACLRRGKVLGTIIPGLLFGWVVMEGLRVYEPWSLRTSAATQRLADLPDPGGVIVANQRHWKVAGVAMFQQVGHRRPIDGGFVSRRPPGLRGPGNCASLLNRLRRAPRERRFRFAVLPAHLEDESIKGMQRRACLRHVRASLDENAPQRWHEGPEIVYRLW
jgi:hypothetical protein